MKHILIIVFLLSASFARAAEPQQPLVLSPFKVLQLVLENNYDVSIKRLEIKRNVFDLSIAEARYDALLEWSLDTRKDNSENSLSVFTTPGQFSTSTASLSKLLPTGTTVSVSAIYEHNNFFNDALSHHNVDLGLAIEQDLLKNAFGIQDRQEVLAQSVRVQSFDLKQQHQILNTCQQALLTFWDYQRASKLWQNAKDNVQLAEDFLNYNLEKEKFGASEQSDVLAAKANYLLQKAQMHSRQAQMLRVRRDLQEVLSISFDQDLNVGIEDKLAQSSYGQVEDLLAKAYAQRLDLKAYRKDLQASGLDLQINRNERLPELALVASARAENREQDFNSALNNSQSFEHNDRFIGLSFSMPLENRRARGLYEQSQLRYEEIRQTLQKLRQTIHKDVLNAHSDAQISYQRLAELKALLDVRRAKLQEEMNKYETGRSSSEVIIDDQNDLLQAENLYSEEFANYFQSLIRLSFAQNSLLSDMGIE